MNFSLEKFPADIRRIAQYGSKSAVHAVIQRIYPRSSVHWRDCAVNWLIANLQSGGPAYRQKGRAAVSFKPGDFARVCDSDGKSQPGAQKVKIEVVLNDGGVLVVSDVTNPGRLYHVLSAYLMPLTLIEAAGLTSTD